MYTRGEHVHPWRSIGPEVCSQQGFLLHTSFSSVLGEPDKREVPGLSTGAALRVRCWSTGRSMVGQGAFEKAMVKKPGGFGASTAPRFKEKPRDASPSTSYSPEISKNYIEKKRSANVSGGGFGASKVSRFEEPKPERFAPPKTGVKPSRTALPPSSDYFEVLAAIEESVANPPPNEMGMAAADAAWLARNATAEGVVTLPCGLQYKELARGRAGASPLLDTPCECTYESFLLDGTLFDSSFVRGRTFDFVPSQMCQGWTVAMQLMGEGDRWELYVPSHMAYGDEGLKSQARGQFVPPGAALVFVLTILKIHGPSRPKARRPPPGHPAAVRAVPAEQRAPSRAPRLPPQPPPPLKSPPSAAPRSPRGACSSSSSSSDSKTAALQATAAAQQLEPFLPADTFAGVRAGYVFKRGERGVGYYADGFLVAGAATSAPVPAPSAFEPAPSAGRGALPPGWFAADAGGVTYYYTASGQRQWERPTSPAPAVGPPPQAPVAAAGEDTGPTDGDGAGWLGSLGGWFR